MTSLQQINEALEKTASFLSPLMPFVGCHMVDFLTLCHWDTLLPCQVKNDLLTLPPHALHTLPTASATLTHPNGQTEEESVRSWNLWESDLRSLLWEVSQHSLAALEVTTPTEQVVDQHGSAEVSVVPMRGMMSCKKTHEVEIMAQVTARLAKEQGVGWVVDLGSGRGYLSSSLVVQYSLAVVGIDASTLNTTSATARNTNVQKLWKSLTRNRLEEAIGKSPRRGKTRRRKNIKQEGDQEEKQQVNKDSELQSSGEVNNSIRGRFLGVTEFIKKDTDLLEVVKRAVHSENRRNEGDMGESNSEEKERISNDMMKNCSVLENISNERIENDTKAMLGKTGDGIEKNYSEAVTDRSAVESSCEIVFDRLAAENNHDEATVERAGNDVINSEKKLKGINNDCKTMPLSKNTIFNSKNQVVDIEDCSERVNNDINDDIESVSERIESITVENDDKSISLSGNVTPVSKKPINIKNNIENISRIALEKIESNTIVNEETTKENITTENRKEITDIKTKAKETENATVFEENMKEIINTEDSLDVLPNLNNLKHTITPNKDTDKQDTQLMNKYVSENTSLGLIGLHTCGNLASNSLRLFMANPRVEFLCNVGCCYHLLEEKFCSNTYNQKKTPDEGVMKGSLQGVEEGKSSQNIEEEGRESSQVIEERKMSSQEEGREPSQDIEERRESSQDIEEKGRESSQATEDKEIGSSQLIKERRKSSQANEESRESSQLTERRESSHITQEQKELKPTKNNTFVTLNKHNTTSTQSSTRQNKQNKPTHTCEESNTLNNTRNKYLETQSSNAIEKRDREPTLTNTRDINYSTQKLGELFISYKNKSLASKEQSSSNLEKECKDATQENKDSNYTTHIDYVDEYIAARKLDKDTTLNQNKGITEATQNNTDIDCPASKTQSSCINKNPDTTLPNTQDNDATQNTKTNCQATQTKTFNTTEKSHQDTNSKNTHGQTQNNKTLNDEKKMNYPIKTNQCKSPTAHPQVPTRSMDGDIDPLHPSHIPQLDCGFPLSSLLKARRFTLGRNARMLASQSAERLTQGTKSGSDALYWRALLQVVLMERLQDISELGHVGRLSAKCKDFPEYARIAMARLGVNIEITDAELEEYHESYLSNKDKLERFFLLRSSLAAVVEGLVLMDRLAFLCEQEGVSAYLVPLFDPLTSPRHHALIAIRNNNNNNK